MINVILKSKEVSSPIKYNGYYKLILMLAIIKYCGRSGKASLPLIHLIFWSIKSHENYNVVRDLKNQTRSSLVPWSFETGIEIILSLSFINNLCEKKISAGEIELQLTQKGSKILEGVINEGLFQEELHKIIRIGQIPKNRIAIANSSWKLT